MIVHLLVEADHLFPDDHLRRLYRETTENVLAALFVETNDLPQALVQQTGDGALLHHHLDLRGHPQEPLRVHRDALRLIFIPKECILHNQHQREMSDHAPHLANENDHHHNPLRSENENETEVLPGLHPGSDRQLLVL